ncbi:MAG: hypothetical protein AAF289_12785 [Cyanobacteria bacterium P01_A01_bin.135]
MNQLENADSTAPSEGYVVLGLAHCFIRDDGDVHEVEIVEPIPSAALEAILKGIPTSYDRAYGTRVKEVSPQGEAKVPSVFPEQAQLCDDFETRLEAAARTYQANTVAQSHIPVGSMYNEFSFSTERKRILNSERLVKSEDNVKQHAYTHQVL